MILIRTASIPAYPVCQNACIFINVSNLSSGRLLENQRSSAAGVGEGVGGEGNRRKHRNRSKRRNRGTCAYFKTLYRAARRCRPRIALRGPAVALRGPSVALRAHTLLHMQLPIESRVFDSNQKPTDSSIRGLLEETLGLTSIAQAVRSEQAAASWRESYRAKASATLSRYRAR